MTRSTCTRGVCGAAERGVCGLLPVTTGLAGSAGAFAAPLRGVELRLLRCFLRPPPLDGGAVSSSAGGVYIPSSLNFVNNLTYSLVSKYSDNYNLMIFIPS